MSAKDGSVVWEREQSNRLVRPVVDKDAIYVGTSEALLALDMDGAIRWQAKGQVREGPWIVDDVIVVARQSELAVYDRKGSLRRRRKHRIKWFDGFAVGNDGAWFATTAAGKLLRLDPSSLDIVQTFVVPGKWAFGCDPVIEDGAIVVNAWAGFVTCFDIESGAVCWRKKKHLSRRGGSLPLDGGDVVVSTPKLVRLRVADGAARWEVDRHIATFSTSGDVVAAVAVNEDFTYELLRVDRDGRVRTLLKRGTAHAYGAPNLASLETWIMSGTALVGNDVVTSHVDGRVLRVST